MDPSLYIIDIVHANITVDAGTNITVRNIHVYDTVHIFLDKELVVIS